MVYAGYHDGNDAGYVYICALGADMGFQDRCPGSAHAYTCCLGYWLKGRLAIIPNTCIWGYYLDLLLDADVDTCHRFRVKGLGFRVYLLFWL